MASFVMRVFTYPCESFVNFRCGFQVIVASVAEPLPLPLPVEVMDMLTSSEPATGDAGSCSPP